MLDLDSKPNAATQARKGLCALNGLPYYKAYPRDFIEGTIGMPFDLKGAYRLVLDLIYMQGGSLPDDSRYISGLLGCSTRAWNGYRKQLIEMGKLNAENGIISNFRADKELESLRSLQDKQRENARGPRKNNNLSKPPHKPKQNHTESEPDKKVSSLRSDTARARKKAVRLSEDWTLPVEWRDDAIKAGISKDQIDAESEKMRDWSLSSPNGAKLDWRATWRNWCKRAAERIGQPRASPPRRRTVADEFFDLADEMDRADEQERSNSGAGENVLRLSSHAGR